jgi:hypothetical protein
MKTTNEKVYRCDHCNRAMVSAGLMKVHERLCKSNPNNQHQCFKYCENLVKELHKLHDEYGEPSIIEASFTCKKRPGIELYSYKLERYKRKKERLEGMERMPLQCDLYEAMDGHDFREVSDYLSDCDSDWS